jgi:pimeloyl-ACP methyl ester carboxylesterase
VTTFDHTAWLAGGTKVQVAEHRVFTRCDGDGPDVLMLHGFPTSSFDWSPTVAALRERWRCTTFDFIGMGASDKPRTGYRIAAQADAAEAVAHARAIERCFLVAHDYGDTVAQELLSRAALGKLGFAIDGLVLLNGGIEPELHRALTVQRVMAGWLGPVLAPLVSRRSTFERSLRRILVNTDDFDFAAHWHAVEIGGGAMVLPRLLHYMEERRIHRARWVGALLDATIPIGLAWGLRDPISGAHMLAWAREHLPRAEVLELEVGHYPQLEATGTFVDWLGRTFAAWQRTRPS